MLEFRLTGAIMILPTLFVAIYIVIKTRQTPELFINLAVLSWISANSFWMLMEFFNHNRYKEYSLAAFALGFIFVGTYYLKRPVTRTS